MKITLIFLWLTFPIVLCAQTEFIYWDNLTGEEQEQLLASKTVNKDALAFHNGELVPGEDDRTLVLLEALARNTDESLRPFYFSLFNQLVFQSDRALWEVMGAYSHKMIFNNPQYFLEYLAYKQPEGDSTLLHTYGLLLGNEFHAFQYGAGTIKQDYDSFKFYLEDSYKLRPAMPEEVNAVLKRLLGIIEETVAALGK